MKLANKKQIKILNMINELCKAEIDLNDIITEERAKDLINRNFESLVEEIDKEIVDIRMKISSLDENIQKNEKTRKDLEYVSSEISKTKFLMNNSFILVVISLSFCLFIFSISVSSLSIISKFFKKNLGVKFEPKESKNTKL